MSPQRSNKSALIEGTLRCIERKPTGRITARDIAAEAGANPASIAYHFGSKDELLAEAMAHGFRRWLEEVNASMEGLSGSSPAGRLGEAVEVAMATARKHRGLFRAFLAALNGVVDDEAARKRLLRGLEDNRLSLARLLGLGDDEVGRDAASLLIAVSDGLLIQSLLDPEATFDAKRLAGAGGRLVDLLAQG